MILSLALSLILAATAPASADERVSTDQPSKAGKADAKPVKPKKICRSDTQDTGSRITRKVCKTQEQWEAAVDGQEVQSKARTN
jgi:hypothetical protein